MSVNIRTSALRPNPKFRTWRIAALDAHTADALGVLMAAGPIYIARLRQVAQGDTRPAGRRASETKRV